MQGREQDRVARAWLATGAGTAPAGLAAEHPGLVVGDRAAGRARPLAAGRDRRLPRRSAGQLGAALRCRPGHQGPGQGPDAGAEGLADRLTGSGRPRAAARHRRPMARGGGAARRERRKLVKIQCCRGAARPIPGIDVAPAHPPAHDDPRPRRIALPAVPRADQAAGGVADRVLRGDRHVPGRAGPAAAGRGVLRHHRHRAGRRRRCGDQLPGRAQDRRGDAAHARPPAPPGRGLVAVDAGVRGDGRRPRAVAAPRLRQSADDVADARHVRRLRDRLHGAAEAGDAAEHRHRRRVRRNAAGARLGRGDRRGRAGGAAAVPDHLRLDAAALLGARALPHAGLREGRPADAAGHARAPLHAADDRALHHRAGRGDAAAVRGADERLPLPRRGARCWAGCSCSTRCSSTATTATSSRGRRSSTRSTISPRCSRRC